MSCGALMLQTILFFWCWRRELVLYSQERGLEYSGGCQVWVGGTVGHSMLEPGAFASGFWNSDACASVIVPPVCPVTRKLSGFEAFVSINRWGAQCSAGFKVFDHARNAVFCQH